MATVRYHKVKIGEHELNAETLMLGYGYDPGLSEGSVKSPVFLTSTFVFQTAEQGRDFFDYLAGRRTPPAEGQPGLVYSRFNHPNLEIVEDRLAIHEKAASGLVFASGMAAIVTLMFAYVRPGETVLYQVPECVTRWGDSRIGCGLIQDGKHMEVCHDGGDFVAG